MSELTVHSVCTKGPIYPTLLHFQNGSPTNDFETHCAVLQNKNKSRTIIMETSELVYAGEEDKEDSGTTLILARDRISGNVRLIEVGSADLKPLTETDLDHLELRHEAKARSKMGSKETKRQNISNAIQMDTGHIVESNKFENLVDCNSSLDELDMPPIDREITEVELDYLLKQQEISRLEFLEFEKKQLDQQNKFRINLETESEPEQTDMEVEETQRLKVFEDNYSEEFHIPPMNRGATRVEDVYHIQMILSKDEYDKILYELKENNYVDDLHPYIKSYMKHRHLSPQFTVLAVYASSLIKYLHAARKQIRTSKICQHSKTLNDIIIKKFTKRAVIISKTIQEKIICHIMVFMLTLNNYRFYLEPLCTAMGIPYRFNIEQLVGFTGASVVNSEIGRQVVLRLPLVRKPDSAFDKTAAECEEREKTDSQQLKEVKSLKNSKDSIKQFISKVRDETVTEKIETVTANDTVNDDLSIKGKPDSDDFYLPSINRDAAQVEHVYPVEKILSKDEYEQIYCELVKSNYTADLHPYILPFIENETLSLESTVLAVYTSELLKFLHIHKKIMKIDFILCHHSQTLNNIIMNRFTKLAVHKHTRFQDMKDKIVCHIIVFTLILSNFSFKLMPLFKSIKIDSHHMIKMIALVKASIINEDSEMTVQLKLPLVQKPQAPIRKLKPHKIVKNFVKQNDDNEIDPDEFYVPFLNREATNIEDVYVIKKIFTEDEYFQICFELAEHNYMGDLHPYIQQFVENKTLSLELTVLAVYASALIKFLHVRLDKIKKDSNICHNSETLNAILFERFTEVVQHEGRKCSGISRSRAMRRKIVCHIIVCTLILNNFQFKMDPFLVAIKMEQIQEPLQKVVSFVAATVEVGDDVDDITVKLKFPLVPKTQATIRENAQIKINFGRMRRKEAETVKIDPDDFYLPTIDRKATELEGVYPIQEILSTDEYEKIHFEIQRNHYEDYLHPYIQSFIGNKTLSSQLLVLATYATELIKFLKVYKNIKNPYFKISRLSNKLNEICRERFITETKMVKNKAQDMKDKMVCHIIVCLLILNNFRFKLADFCNAVKGTYKTKHVEKMVSLVGAVIVKGDEGALVELKLPLVPKKKKIRGLLLSKRITVNKDLTEYDENMILDSAANLPNTQSNIRADSKIDPLQHDVEKESVVPDTENVDQEDLSKVDEEDVSKVDKEDLSKVDQEDVSKVDKEDLSKVDKEDLSKVDQEDLSKVDQEDLSNVDQEDVSKVDQGDLSKVNKENLSNENIKDAVYLPPINRQATKLEDIYPLEKILSQDTYKEIECELKDSNYKEDLHPCVLSYVKKKSLSSELTVLAVYASSLIKYLNSDGKDIKKANYRICPHSKTLNNILIKGFTELVTYQNDKYKKIVRIKSANMKIKSVCYIMICMLNLNNFNFKLAPLNDALKKTCGLRFMMESVRLVGAIIDYGDGGSIVKLQLPSTPSQSQLPLKPLDRKTDLSKYDIIDPDDFYLPSINRDATELENVYFIDKILSKSEYKKIYCELEKSNYSGDLHPFIQSIVETKSLSLQFTVLAIYASELIKLIHVPSQQLRRNDFKICHISKTLNDIIMKGFTEFSEYKIGGNRKYMCRISSPDMKVKIVCHVIVCVLILNNFQCKLDALSDAVKRKKNTRSVQEMVSLVGALIVDGDEGKMVQLKLPLLPKTHITRRKQSTKIIQTAGFNKSQ